MKQAIGVCLGASSASCVKLALSDKGAVEIIEYRTRLHNGAPKEVFLEMLSELMPESLPVVVTGRKFRNLVSLTSISEPEAVEYAFSQLKPSLESRSGYTAIASLGGETFIVYTLDDEGKISNLITKNQCASGTGEFFMQQIKRMDLKMDEAVEISRNVEPLKVTGRCSVFCKSDCTHALNKGAERSSVAAGLADMMADKVSELLKKVKPGKTLVVGGVTRNAVVMDFLCRKFPNIEIPEISSCFEAYGAACYALFNEAKIYKAFDEVFVKKESSFVFHQPLENYSSRVVFKESERGTANQGDRCLVGLDVGSTTTKAVIIRQTDCKILASVYLYTHGNPIKASRKCYEELLEQLNCGIIVIGLGVTGSGRHIAGLHALTEGIINEIVAHASAAVFYDPEVDTIFEIGGQDAKYTYIVNKVPADYAMNEACSAGTGSFIEEAARESLEIDVKEIEPLAMKGITPPNFSDQCSAFISSDIKTAQQENLSKEDIIAGLVYSICLNYVNKVKGNRPIGRKIFMQGGVCYNKAIPIAMAGVTGIDIIVPPDPGLMGAFGVALEVKQKIELGLMPEREYDLAELAGRQVSYRTPFICRGGKEQCDRKCQINMIEVLGKAYPFGGACNKYYNITCNSKIDTDKYDYVKKRHELTFRKYAPEAELHNDAKTVGINNSFHTHTMYPLLYNFFTKLGFRVVLSEFVEDKGLERETASFCYPAQLSLGLFQDLLDRKPDYYFVPNILEMYVEDADYHRLDFNCACAFLSSEPLFLKQAYKDYNLDGQFISPSLNFASGYGTQEKEFISAAAKMGISDNSKALEAYLFAVWMQEQYQKELFSIGADFLEMLEAQPDEFAVILVGRPYNSFTDIANKGIPQKLASRGVYAVPYDMIDYRGEAVDDNQYWESGKKILKSARIIERHPQLFAVYISNFSCAPDSLIMTVFRTIMGSKPSLTLELDSHTADAGINTRIDAALDIIRNYRNIKGEISDYSSNGYAPASVELDNDSAYFITSEGKRVPLNSEEVVILIPSMGDLGAAMFSAAIRSLGFNAEALPEGNPDILRYGRANCTGKECLPLVLCVGSLMDYLENRWDGKKYVAFFIAQGAGNCRLGMYPVFMRNLIARRRIKNVAILALQNEDGFAGLGPNFSMRGIQAIIASDVLEDIRSAIMANSADPETGIKIFDEEFLKLENVMAKTPKKFYSALSEFSKTIKNKAPARINIRDSKYIALCGEIYVRRDGFSHKWLNRRFANQGFIIKDAYISEWIMYVDYLLGIGLLEPLESFKNKYERLVRNLYMRYAEYRTKKILEKSGYYKYMKIDIKALLDHSKHIVPLEYKGEPGLTLGVALHETLEKFCGVINIGPFGCMPTRIAESLALPEMKVECKVEASRRVDPDYELPELFGDKMTIPFLTIEADGNVYPQVIEARLETFTLQAERTAKLMAEAKKNVRV